MHSDLTNEPPWEQARALPDLIAERWRDPEAWRALAEQHAGGRRYLRLPGLVDRAAALALRDAAASLAFTRLKTDLVQADRVLLGPTDLTLWTHCLLDSALRTLVSAVLARPMPRGLVMNVWRLGPGDAMGVHPDGRLYRGTISLGLAEGWDEADGGAIAFGEPTDETRRTLNVTERWYPHLGDACLFAPDVDTWHCVEPVVGTTRRLSLTGWWTEPEDGLTLGRE